MNLILPEDRELTLSAICDLRDGARSYEYRIRRPSDGAVRWLRSARVSFDEPLMAELGGHGLADETAPGGRVTLRP